MTGRLMAWLLAVLGAVVSRLGGWHEDDADEEQEDRGCSASALYP